MTHHLFLFVLLSLLDGLSTWCALRLGLAEGNGVPAAILAQGEGWLWVGKLWITLYVLAAVVWLGRHWPRVRWALWAGNGVLVLVVGLNVWQLV